MKLKKLKAAVVLLACFVTAFSCSLSVFAENTNAYKIADVGGMTVYLPENMTAITRQSQNTDRYFSLFGLDYDDTMSNFTASDIYLQGMDDEAKTTVTVTMTQNADSRDISNYNLLSSEKLSEITDNFLQQSEYTACTPDTDGTIVWLYFNTVVNDGSGTINAYQANTVYDGMSVNITMQRNEGSVTPEDYIVLQSIASSAAFGSDGAEEIALPLLIAAAVLAVVFIIIMIIVIKKSAGKRKKQKLQSENDKILEELATKYGADRSDLSEPSAEKGDGEYEQASYDGDTQAEYEEQSIDINAGAPSPRENSYTGDYELPDLDRVISEEEIDEILGYRRSIEEEKQRLAREKAAEANLTEPKASASGDVFVPQPQDEGEGDYVFEEFDEDEAETDEELIRIEARRTRFEDSDDFFEEAPKRSVGVISSKELAVAEDFDVIKEVEEKASRVERSDKSSEPFGRALARGFKGFANAAGSFFVHLGYFCTNIYRMIKRKSQAKKRRKAEQERRERARQRAERERNRQNATHNGGLVRVHSRSDSRSPQGKRQHPSAHGSNHGRQSKGQSRQRRR